MFTCLPRGKKRDEGRKTNYIIVALQEQEVG